MMNGEATVEVANAANDTVREYASPANKIVAGLNRFMNQSLILKPMVLQI
jgi:hypothetical protein